jgi:hypothetical protein
MSHALVSIPSIVSCIEVFCSFLFILSQQFVQPQTRGLLLRCQEVVQGSWVRVIQFPHRELVVKHGTHCGLSIDGGVLIGRQRLKLSS